MLPPPPTDVVLAATDAAPSLLGAALRLGAAVTLIAAAAWAWLFWQRRVKGPTRYLEVLDRAFLARGASVALLRAGERRLLLGVSAEGVRLIRDLDPAGEVGDGDDEGADRDRAGAGFTDILKSTTRALRGVDR